MDLLASLHHPPYSHPLPLLSPLSSPSPLPPPSPLPLPPYHHFAVFPIEGAHAPQRNDDPKEWGNLSLVNTFNIRRRQLSSQFPGGKKCTSTAPRVLVIRTAGHSTTCADHKGGHSSTTCAGHKDSHSSTMCAGLKDGRPQHHVCWS